MKTAVASAFIALTMLAGVVGTASAATLDGYPGWAQEAFSAGGGR